MSNLGEISGVQKINSIFFNKIEILFNLLLQVKTIHRQHAVQHFAT